MYSEPIGLEIVYAMLEDKHQLETWSNVREYRIEENSGSISLR